jgi:toxin ParE1/3/4
MANNYTIKMTPKAADDLDSIYRYILEELFAASAATNILERIEKEIIRLREFPFSCNYVADGFLRNKGYRKLIVDNYIVFYLIDEKSIKLLSCESCTENKIMKICFNTPTNLGVLSMNISGYGFMVSIRQGDTRLDGHQNHSNKAC